MLPAWFVVVLCNALLDGSSHHLHLVKNSCVVHIYHNVRGVCRCIGPGACPISSVMCVHDTVTVIIDEFI